jgi:hypothetical protein
MIRVMRAMFWGRDTFASPKTVQKRERKNRKYELEGMK